MQSFREFLEEKTTADLFDFDEIFYEGFEIILEKSARSNQNTQPWPNVSGSTADEKSKSAKEIYDRARGIAEKVEGKMSRMMKNAASKSKNAKIITNIKPEKSFIDKIVNRGRSADEITDVLRGAILVQTDADVVETERQVLKDFVISEFRSKNKGDDQEFGYFGSKHFLVVIDGMICEIQLMTKRLWSYKKQAHKVYTKHRSGKLHDFDRDKTYSKELFKKGNLKLPKKGKKREF